jgi:hypothetical protein
VALGFVLIIEEHLVGPNALNSAEQAKMMDEAPGLSAIVFGQPEAVVQDLWYRHDIIPIAGGGGVAGPV